MTGLVGALDGGHRRGDISATRRRLVAEYADTEVLLIGTHVPPPSAGHLVTEDGAVRFRPAGHVGQEG